MLKWRLISALLGLPLLIAALWFGGPAFLVVTSLLAVLAGLEWWNLAGGHRLGPAARWTKPIFLAGLIFIVVAGGWDGLGLAGQSVHALTAAPAWAGLAAGLGFLLYALVWTGASFRRHFDRREQGLAGAPAATHPPVSSGPLPGVALVVVGWLYIGFTFAHWPALRALGDSLASPAWAGGPLLWVIAVVWSGDAAAYFAGSRWGRHKLIPHLSPNKSVEGAVAGLAASVAVAVLLHSWPGWPLVSAALAGMLAAAAGQLGDLWESALKREAGVKDSGGLIPGHGGILDRFDSLLLAVPITYYLLLWLPRLRM